MFEKGMDERMLFYRGRGLTIGCLLFVGLLFVKDVLNDFSLVTFGSNTTIIDMILAEFSLFVIMGYMLHKRASRDSYILRAWGAFLILSGFSIFWMLPVLLTHSPLIEGDVVTDAALRIVQGVVTVGYTIILLIHYFRVKRELISD